jgi:hypothetical protein
MRPSLHDTHAEWHRSQHALRAGRELLRGAARDGLEVALENALMGLTLEHPGAGPDALWQALDAGRLADSFRFAGVVGDDAEVAAQRVLPALRAGLAGAPAPAPVEVRLTEEALEVGDFVQPRVVPVERLLRVARERHGEAEGVRAVATAALRYAALFARTRHIGPPQVVYDAFHAWGIRNEGFASPFNSRLLDRPDAGYFSAFPDTDGPLGSRGSFFSADPADHPGHWCVDPPFLPALMRRVDAVLRGWRARPDGPSILLIIPTSHTPDAPVDETVVLTAGVHHYTGLDGGLHPLPVDVAIHRLGPLPGWDPEVIRRGYLPEGQPAASPRMAAGR